KREEPPNTLVGVDLLDLFDVLAGELKLVSESPLDHVERHSRRIISPASRSDEAMPVGIGSRLGSIRAAGFAQDAADVVGGGVLAYEQHAADFTVAEALCDEAQ